jgi:hypothetical protein
MGGNISFLHCRSCATVCLQAVINNVPLSFLRCRSCATVCLQAVNDDLRPKAATASSFVHRGVPQQQVAPAESNNVNCTLPSRLASKPWHMILIIDSVRVFQQPRPACTMTSHWRTVNH